MSENLEKIKERIRKLLALSKSPNENEALLALEKANELREKYNLDYDSCKYAKSTIRSSGIRCGQWDVLLSQFIGWLYACRVVQSPSENRVFYFGREIDVFLAGEMRAYLYAAIERGAKNNVPAGKNGGETLKKRNSYKLGAAISVCERIEALGNAASWAPEREAIAREVAERLQDGFEKINDKTRTVLSDVGSYYDGAAYGNEISLAKQTKNDRQAPLIGR